MERLNLVSYAFTWVATEKKSKNKQFVRDSRAANSRRILNSFKLSCTVLFIESIKRIRLKTTKKKWNHLFAHFKSMVF